MATAACLLPSDEKADNFRLLSLIIDGGTYVLRNKFDKAHSSSDLKTALNDPNIRGKLSTLRTKKIINNGQWDLLFPLHDPPNSKKFDISLLACLLKYICGLDENASAWACIPPSFDTSTEADISRLRYYRNKISHRENLMLTKQDFQRDWNEMEQVILRLGKGCPQLLQSIQALKNGSLDPSKEMEYQATVTEWEKMDENMRHDIDAIRTNVNHHGTCIENLELSVEKLMDFESKHNEIDEWTRQHKEDHQVFAKSSVQSHCENIISRTASFISTQAISDPLYVNTTSYEIAKTKLKENGCIVLCGLPGEGKTTLATKLLFDMVEPQYRIMLNAANEWTHLSMSGKAVFIDDIFGGGIFKETLLNEWSTVLSEITRCAKFVIITTRDYILDQAKKKMTMKCLNIFAQEHMHRISSSALSHSEKERMLNAHLKFSKRSFSDSFARKCVTAYNASTLMGFPEVARLFANNSPLFSKGTSIFSNPSVFVKNCLIDLFHDKNTFMAMILIWCNVRKTLKIVALETEANNIPDIARRFGYKINYETKQDVLKSLAFHRNGFLTFNTQTGSYTFCHNIVSDMVGLVAGQDHTAAILEFADEEFVMQYITTDKNKEDGFHILIDEFRFEQLNSSIRRYIKLKPYHKEREQIDTPQDNRKKKPEKVKFREMPLFIGEDMLNASVVKHDCFNNRKYVEQFLEMYNTSSFPAVRFRGQFGYYGIDVGNRFLTIHLPLRVLLYDNTMLLDVFLEKEKHVARYSGFLYVGMLIASHKGLIDVADLLLKHGGKICEDAIFIAAENSDIEMLTFLLQKRGHHYSNNSNIMHKNSPLIAVAKRGLISPMKCLLKHGVDINYRNANGATALAKAIIYEQIDACRILLENGAKVNEKAGKYKRTPLHLAADIGANQIVQLLLKHGAEVKIKDYRGHYPIFCAAIQREADTVDVMLKEDSSQGNLRISSYGKKSFIKGMYLMHVAVWKNCKELLIVLLQNNVCPDTRDFYGRTPFYCAVDSGRLELAEILLRVSNVKLAEKNSFTPLHSAIHHRFTEMALQICPLADVNAQDKFGKTALHTACEKLDYEIFFALAILFKADLRILTNSGKSIMNILHDTLLHPLLSKFMSPKKFKRMSVDGVSFGEHHLKANETWDSFRQIIEMKDPEFVDTWIQVFSRSKQTNK